MSRLIDLTGQKFGNLFVIERAESRGYNSYWKCRCDLCGTEKAICANSLTKRNQKTCGCLRRVDLTGLKFGKWTVIEKTGKDKNSRALWECKCDCGKTVLVNGNALNRGVSKSCGCSRKERAKGMGINNQKHGHCISKDGKSINSKTYNSWYSMTQRCRYIKQDSYSSYGGRGIIVCDKWKDFSNFLRDMGERPDGTSLDRINSDGNYEPSNCRWASFRKQTENRRKEIYIKNLIYDTKSGFSVDITKQNNAFL